MNLKALKGSAAALAMVGLVGCGQGYSPDPADHRPGPQGGGDVFGSNDDDTTYRTASYAVLRYTLTDVLALGEAGSPTAAADCGGATLPNCPKAGPVQYLDANRSSLGEPVYTDNPDSTQVPSGMSSGGFKAWMIAASSACGRMMTEQAQPALFPNAITDYTYMYNVLLGRSPTPEEIGRLDALRGDFSGDQMQGAAVCSAVLGSLEFLTVN